MPVAEIRPGDRAANKVRAACDPHPPPAPEARSLLKVFKKVLVLGLAVGFDLKEDS